MRTDEVGPGAARQQLIFYAARQRIDDRELERAIYRAANSVGLSLLNISDTVGTYSPGAVQRILARITADPSRLQHPPRKSLTVVPPGSSSTPR